MTSVGSGRNPVFTEKPRHQESVYWQWILIAVALVGIGLRLRQYLFDRPLWLDEASLGNNIIDRGIVQLLTERLSANQSAPPGFLLFTRTAAEFFGPHEWALRLFPLATGVLSVLLALVLARRELRSVCARITFVGLSALSPILIFYASELKQYSSDAFFTLCMLLAFSYRSSKHGTALLSVTGFVALLFSLPAFFVGAAAGLLILYEGAQSSRWRQTVVVGLAWCAGLALHGLYHLQAGVNRRYMKAWWGDRNGFAPFVDSFEDISWYANALADLLHQTFVAASPVGPGFSRLQWSDPLPWFLTLAFVLSAIAAIRSRRAIFMVAIGAILVALAASALRIYPFSSRVIIFLTPIVLLILAAGVDELDRRAGAAASGLLSISLIAIAGFTATRIALEPVSFSDMRGVLEKTRGRIQEGDAVIGGRLNGSLIRFYRRGTIPANVPVFGIRLKEGADPVVDIVRKHGFQRVWFVAGHRVAEADQIIEETERTAPIIFRLSVRGGRLALFDFSNSPDSGRPGAPGANSPDAERQAEDDASSEIGEPPTARH